MRGTRGAFESVERKPADFARERWLANCGHFEERGKVMTTPRGRRVCQKCGPEAGDAAADEVEAWVWATHEARANRDG